MSAKEKILTLVAVIGIVVLMVTIVDSVEGRLMIEDLEIDYGDPGDGCLTWKNHGSENATANLTIKIDGIIILHKEITSDIHWVAGFLINPYEWEYFDLNETSGQHVITANIGNSSRMLEYIGRGIKIEADGEEEDEEEDWLPCPSGC
jgi:hypothetical protein